MTADQRELAAIFAGGAAGALLRTWLARHLAPDAGAWPWVTFAINVAGAFALGYLVAWLQERERPPAHLRSLLGTGFCGALTTFSTMQVEAFRLAESGHYATAVAYPLSSVAAGYLAVRLASSSPLRPGRHA